MTRSKLILFGAELLAVVILRAVYLWRRENKARPSGSRVESIGDAPIYQFPFAGRPKKKEPPFTWKPNPQFQSKARPPGFPETPST